MSMDPGAPNSHTLKEGEKPEPVPRPDPKQVQTCRVCGQDTQEGLEIFGKDGRRRNIPEKCQKCLPVLIAQDDHLSKTVCPTCIDRLDDLDKFFDLCQGATQQQVIQHRKARGSPLDLDTHINQFVRSFQPPLVPQIKLEPSNFCDVDIDAPDDEYLDHDNKTFVGEDVKSNYSDDDDFSDFKIPQLKPKKRRSRNNGNNKNEIKQKRKRKQRRRQSQLDDDDDENDEFDFENDDEEFELDEEDDEELLGWLESKENVANKIGTGKRPGRKRVEPASLKSCLECGILSPDHVQNLDHWKDKHPDKEVSYKCTEKECDFKSEKSEEMFKHFREHKKEKKNSISPKKEETVEDCTVCGKSYPRSYLYNRHMQTHTDQKDYRCGTCFKPFKSTEGLRAHAKTHVPDDEKYTHCCELCGRRFTQRANLDAHLRVHNGYKPYSCDFCAKTFSQKGNMEEHRRTHTGEKPYVCEICGSSYTRRSELQLHNRCAHTHERPFQCAYCPKNFQRRDLLRKHERIHTDTRPYACQYCQKSFTQRDKMVVHTRLHTGERPYVCDICGKGFCESGNLKKHLRVHGKPIPKVMHQNNKGKPAPVATASSLQEQLLAQANNDSAVVSSLNLSSEPGRIAGLDLQNLAELAASADHKHLIQQQQNNKRSGTATGTVNEDNDSRSYTPQAAGTSTSSTPAPVPIVVPKVEQQPFFAMNLQHNENIQQLQLQQQQQQQQLQMQQHLHDDQSDTGSERSVTPVISTASVQRRGQQQQQQQQQLYSNIQLFQHLSEMREWPSGANLNPGGGGNIS